MNEANQCPIDDKSDLPWAPELPESSVLKAPDLWAAILDPECKTKGRVIAVQNAALASIAQKMVIQGGYDTSEWT